MGSAVQRNYFFTFAIAKYRRIASGIYFTHAQCAWKKLHHKRTLTAAVTVSPCAHTKTAGSSWCDPSPQTNPPYNPRVRAWKDCTSLDHLLIIFNLFHHWKDTRSLNFDLILSSLSQPLPRTIFFHAKCLSRKHQCWTHPQAELCHTLQQVRMEQNSKAVQITSPLSALKKGLLLFVTGSVSPLVRAQNSK